MDFNNLSTESYAGFILAIVFTVAAFAGAIYLIKHLDCNKVLRVITAVVLPFFAILCWLYTILSMFNFELSTNFYISIGSTVCFFLLLFAVYGIIVLIKNKKSQETVTTTETTVVTETNPQETATTKETLTQTNINEEEIQE